MKRIAIFQKDIPAIGLFTRINTQGDEFSLVQQFIDYYCDVFIQNNKKDNLAVFIEPRISSGFPDIIFASYLPSIMNNWSEARKKLDINDLKVLSQILLTNGTTGIRLLSDLKLSEGQLLISLEKLLDAKLILYSSKMHYWKPREIRDIFSITKLISVEAKINNVGRLMQQSIINTWFASQSYALTKTANPQNDTIKTFSECGIGLYCKKSSFQKILEAKKLALPSSYLSLQFNEWIGNSLAI